MHRISRFLHNHPFYIYAAYVLVVTGLGIVLIWIFIENARLPGTVWLPDNSGYTSTYDTLEFLPVKAETVGTEYGKAVHYTSSVGYLTPSFEFKVDQPSINIYEFKAGTSALKASDCPNISHIEPVSPSDCEKAGTFRGNTVYKIAWALPSETVDYYVKLDGTFVYVRGGDLDYLRSFQPKSRSSAISYLASNSQRAKRAAASRVADKNATDRADAASYLKLNFTPALATYVPPGWSFDNKHVTIDGPDVNHPKLVVTGYYKKEKSGQPGVGIDWFSGNLADFVVMGTCGPSFGDSLAYVPCTKVPGTDRYVAVVRDEYQDYQRFEYQVVGNSLVITSLTVCTCGGKPAQVPPDSLLQIQDQITASAKPVSKDSLKGSKYLRSYYDPPTPDAE
ncbi:MAG TPA: hypothetical protein VN554_00590 [Verrucomicrobiae bacterium]|nr:hypothetical protein [Verrucomicrobiae bacterium]